MLSALLIVFAGAAVHIAFLVAGRWAAGIPTGGRSLREAWQPITDTKPRAWARAAGGTAGWYLAASVMMTLNLLAGGETRVDETSMRVRVSANGAAARSGMKDGDRILSVEGKPIPDWDSLRAEIAKHADEPIRVTVERGGGERVFQPVPTGSPARIGVGPAFVRETPSVGHALAKGIAWPARIVGASAKGIVRAFGGGEKAELSGPVGIVREVAEARRSSTSEAVGLVAALGAYFLPIVALASAITAARARRKSKALPTEGKSS